MLSAAAAVEPEDEDAVVLHPDRVAMIVRDDVPVDERHVAVDRPDLRGHLDVL